MGVVIGHVKVCSCLQHLLDISGFTGSFGYSGFQDGFFVGERVHVKLFLPLPLQGSTVRLGFAYPDAFGHRLVHER